MVNETICHYWMKGDRYSLLLPACRRGIYDRFNSPVKENKKPAPVNRATRVCSITPTPGKCIIVKAGFSYLIYVKFTKI